MVILLKKPGLIIVYKLSISFKIQTMSVSLRLALEGQLDYWMICRYTALPCSMLSVNLNRHWNPVLVIFVSRRWGSNTQHSALEGDAHWAIQYSTINFQFQTRPVPRTLMPRRPLVCYRSKQRPITLSKSRNMKM